MKINIEQSRQFSIKEIEEQLRELRIRFKNDAVDIANKCDVPIEVLFSIPATGKLFRHGQGCPFQISIIEKHTGSKGTYILGGSELTNEEKEIIEAFKGNIIVQ